MYKFLNFIIFIAVFHRMNVEQNISLYISYYYSKYNYHYTFKTLNLILCINYNFKKLYTIYILMY